MPNKDEKWDFFPCLVNDKQAFIALNLAAARAQKVKPQLIWLFFYLQNPREDGLHHKEEADTVYAIEDAIAASLGRSQIEFVGRIATDGRREMYFYGPEGSSIEDYAKGAMRQFPAYHWETGRKMDPEWHQFHQVLYPTPEDRQRMGNRSVLQNLVKNGDSLEEMREVDHWSYFPAGPDAQAFAQAASELGYKATLEGPDDRRPNHCVRLARIDSVQQQDIDRVTLELFALARKHNGKYDGWECPIMKKQ